MSKSSLLSSLTDSMRKNAPRTLRGRANMVGKILEFGEKTIKVEMLSGPITGQVVDIDPGNKKVIDFEKPSKAQTSSYTPIGGILRFDSVQLQNDGTYKSAWTNAWIKTPGDEHHLLTDQLISYNDAGRTNANGQPIISLRALDAKNEAAVSTLDEMRDKLAEAFASSGSALLIDISKGYEANTFYLPGKRDGDKYVHEDPKEFAAKLIDDMDEAAKEAFTEQLSNHGLTIVPLRNIPVGSKSAEEAKNNIAKAEEKGAKARIMTVNPYAYEAPSIGIRLSGALSRKDRDGELDIPAEYADRLKEAFLGAAPESAKAAFHADGWRGVSDTDLKDFFKAQGVELKDHPKMAWNKASIHMQKFDGSENFFAAKTHEANRYGSPYPALECCKDLRAEFVSELTDAVKAVAQAPAVSNETKAEAPGAAEEAADAGETAAAEMDEQEQADIDALLDGIADEPMA